MRRAVRPQRKSNLWEGEKEGRNVEWKSLKSQWFWGNPIKPMGSPQTRDRAGSYHRSPLCPRKVSAFVSLLSSVISCRACGKHGHSMNVAVYFRALLGPLVHVMLPAVRDLRGPYLWPPHAETEELRENFTELTEIKSGSLCQAIWSQTHVKHSTTSSRKELC